MSKAHLSFTRLCNNAQTNDFSWNEEAISRAHLEVAKGSKNKTKSTAQKMENSKNLGFSQSQQRSTRLLNEKLTMNWRYKKQNNKDSMK